MPWKGKEISMTQFIVIVLTLALALPVLRTRSSPAEHPIQVQPGQPMDARDVSEDIVSMPGQMAHLQEDGNGDYAARTAVAGVETLRRFLVSSLLILLS